MSVLISAVERRILQSYSIKENLLLVTMRRPTEQQRWFANGLLRGGSAQAYVARKLRVSQSVDSRLWNLWRQTRNVVDLLR